MKQFISAIWKWSIKKITSNEKAIFTISNLNQWNSIYPQLKKEAQTLGAVGFDCEWTHIVGKRRPVALLQLATSSGLCALIRLKHLNSDPGAGGIPDSLKNLLSDENIIKAGVGIRNDEKYLHSDYNLTIRGIVDLMDLEKQIQTKRKDPCNKNGLKALTERHLGRHLKKDWRIRGGDWEVPELSKLQKDYAAEDALVGVQLLIIMVFELYEPSKACSLPRIQQIAQAIRSVCKDLVDIPCKDNVATKDGNVLSGSKQQNKSLKSFRRAYSTRKSPLYHNCQLLAPDGEPLCTCDPAKALWYVKKELGDFISKDPIVVQLRFEPAGRPDREGSDGMFYLQDRFNLCVICGKEESYIRKNVVPHEYRKYFPCILKTHQSHDVVLLCIDCHRKSNITDTSLRFRLAEEFQAPIGCETDVKTSVDNKLKGIKKAGNALLKSKERLPRERVEFLENLLKEFFNSDDAELTREQIIEAASLDTSILNEEYSPHGFKVYEVYKKLGLVQLERRWRQWFLDTMSPKFMPDNWSISHNHEKLRMKMARYALDDPIRDDYKEALVGTEGFIDVPYNPVQIGERTENCASFYN